MTSPRKRKPEAEGDAAEQGKRRSTRRRGASPAEESHPADPPSPDGDSGPGREGKPQPAIAKPDADDEFADDFADVQEDDPAFLAALVASADAAEATFSSPPASPAKPAASSKPDVIMVTRSAVLQMWAAAVCRLEGYSRGTAASFAKVLAHEFAQTRKQTLGMAPKDSPQEAKWKQAAKKRSAQALAGQFPVEAFPAFGTEVLAAENAEGEVRGIIADETSASTVDAKGAERFLRGQFGARFDEVERLMDAIAKKKGTRDDIGSKAYRVYEDLRPPFTAFGAKSPWDLDMVRKMAE
ncbi:hypothetical protein DFJ74DRAFT_646010 [Hyaloraphidium curvatum]|nr:hypothetical protein DFJ74DRAFT_646010 [Hyaloraphidium curvatum]